MNARPVSLAELAQRSENGNFEHQNALHRSSGTHRAVAPVSLPKSRKNNVKPHKVMFTARVRVNPHNDLGKLAHYQVEIIRAKVSAGNIDGIALDCMGAIIAMAFCVESILNYVGHIKFQDKWRERASYATKIKVLEGKIGFTYDKAVEPFRTLELLRKARNEMAHGKPMEFTVQLQSPRELGLAMAPTWRPVAEPELVVVAFERVRDFRALLFSKGRIKPGAALTSAMSGGSEANE